MADEKDTPGYEKQLTEQLQDPIDPATEVPDAQAELREDLKLSESLNLK